MTEEHTAENDAPYFCGLHDAGVLGARCDCPKPSAEIDALTALLDEHDSEAWQGGWRCRKCGFTVSIGDDDARRTWKRHQAEVVVEAGWTRVIPPEVGAS